MVLKCNNCGIEYVDSLPDCPYCGIPNLRHSHFVNSIQKENAYERVMKHKDKYFELPK
jgi:hypothetical protein